MPLFQNSSLTVSSAITQISRSGGAATFTAEQDRALEALQRAFRWWNREGPWEFTRTYNGDIAVVGGTATYDLPYDIYALYDVRLSSASPGKLAYIGRRYYDSIQADQSSASTPYAYDLFRMGAQGKIELIPTPGSGDVLLLKYYRRLVLPCNLTSITVSGSAASAVLTGSSVFGGATIGAPVTGTNIAAGTVVKSITDTSTITLSANPTGTVTSVSIGGTGQLLDIPSDYEDGIMNKAISLYLFSRGDHAERAATYDALANDVMRQAKAVNFLNPDEEVVFVAPNDVGNAPFNPNSVTSARDYWF